MTRDRRAWDRNVAGLRRTAREKAAATRRRAEEALALLVKEGRPITFTAVAAAAQVSTAWLYSDEDLKARIAHLRAQQAPRPTVQVPPHERASDASKDAVIAALRATVKEVRAENEELRKQLEVAYGLVQAARAP
jgi:hypothetical protein